MHVAMYAKWITARIILSIALILPYRARLMYGRMLAALLHAPFTTFGRLARALLQRLNIVPRISHERNLATYPKEIAAQSDGAVLVLYSGGTDSTCVAALMAQQHTRVHLVTFTESGTDTSPIPTHNFASLQAAFPAVHFSHEVISVDALVKYYSYSKYASLVRSHGLAALATPGYSALAWHTAALQYCKAHGITRVVDGLTRELLHFPGHMDSVISLFTSLYANYGVTYENPVRSWPAPADRQFIDQVLVNRHPDYLWGGVEHSATGAYLYDVGVFNSPNVKGTQADFAMQHGCYPFALYNILTFWGHLTFEPYEVFSERIASVMRDRIELAYAIIDGRTHVAGNALQLQRV